jgi:GT2 family glycosyltransferase
VSLSRMDYTNYEVIVVDNASTDGSRNLAKQAISKFNNGHLILLECNIGFTMANNIAIAQAKGDYLLLLNPDTVIDSTCLRSLLKAFQEDPSLGVAQPKIIRMDGRTIDSAGCFITKFGFAFTRGQNMPDSNEFNHEIYISYAKGAAMMVRREVMSKLGSFDPLFEVYYQETDFCWRAWEAGFTVKYVPSSIVYHVGGAINSRYPEYIKSREACERLTFLAKHYPFLPGVFFVAAALLLTLGNGLRLLVGGKARFGTAVIRGILSFLLSIPNIVRSRYRLVKAIRNNGRGSPPVLPGIVYPALFERTNAVRLE